MKNLRNLWQKIDWPDDDYSRHALPSIDPDLIGPDDIRTPLPQNPTYQIWENRRKWIDSQIQDTFDAITSGGGSPPRSRSKNLLCEMRETFTYTTRYGSTNEYRAWPDNYNIDTLDDNYRKFQKGEELEDIEQVLENTLHITTDEFSRLVEIKNKDELYTSNNNLECVTIEEWDEFISILVQIRKRVVFEGWISEEEIPSIRLDCNYFVISAGQPEQGSWPLKQDVLLDPSIFPVDKIKQSLNYHKIIEIYNDHETALKTIYQRKQAEREDSKKGYIWLLEDSFGIRKAEIESWNAQLADSHMTTSANARHYVENTLQLKVEGEFDYLISIKEKQANGDTITEDEWRQIYTILTQQ
ncbi:MAG: hypothetical protein KAR20_22245, partial [Candidatus Heimdallarchaeota archaeon]|nr:hypothetical protein [Candidatus Heimdallarchaeota archaeon]